MKFCENTKLLNVTQTRFKSITQHSFSPLPYSVFRCDVSGLPHGLVLKQTLGKYSWRNTLVSLRAPKHFKVGRQHYSKPSRVIKLSLTRTTSTLWVKPHNAGNSFTLHAATVRAQAYATQTVLRHPMTTTKQVQVCFSAQIRLPPIP